MTELPKRDPIGAYRRKERGQRRVGADARCACGEDRPEALAAGRDPIVCAACIRKQAGKTTIDHHHVDGVANSPITVPVPVNDHRADITTAMQDWPADTRDNPDGSPVLAAAASVRGFMDYVIYLFRRSLQWVPEMLEALDRLLRRLLALRGGGERSWNAMPRNPNEPPHDALPLACRVYPVTPDLPKPSPSRRRWRRPDAMLVFDTETRTDATQRLTFGSYRFLVRGQCLEEGLFYADDLPDADRDVLRTYVESHVADVGPEGVGRLQLLTLNAFLGKLYEVAYQARGLLVGFNLAFDLSRLAHHSTDARKGSFAGGFSLRLWSYQDAANERQRHPFRPRVAIKHLDSKRALIGFTGTQSPSPVDQIPEGSPTGTPDPAFIFQGHFVDLRRLAFALTDRGYSLDAACRAFGVTHGKQAAATHGAVTASYIDYNRRDVLATAELAALLLAEYDTHPITLPVTYAYSPAGIGKAYLRAMGMAPILERQPDFPLAYLGHAQSAFYGGRTSAHIRRVPVPVAYTDFLSMYPTVNSLMGLWQFVTAARITVRPHCQAEIAALLQTLQPDDLFDPATWPKLTAFVRVRPQGDVLPCRSRYGGGHDWQVGLNHLHTSDDNGEALWYALPDIVASVLLTGQMPEIVDAFRLEAEGLSPDLTPTRLRGVVSIDPRQQDFFRVAIEERKRLASRTDLSPDERARSDKALKVFANATSYGIYAEMRRDESGTTRDVQCHGVDPEPFSCQVAHPDVPGEYCFPPLASLITRAARLMLALLEHQVSALGGTYAMEDTDSMAIVATKRGGPVPCPGGPHRTADGHEAIHALSWAQVERIAARFAALNPYDPSAVPGSILKIEEDNFDHRTGKQRQLHCLAISAKRYALFLQDSAGEPVLLRQGVNNHDDRWSQHGLGHLRNPTDPTSDDRGWIGRSWLMIIRHAMGLPTEDPDFAHRPAVGQVTISSPAVMRPFADLNRGKAYSDQLKPFNFLVTCHVRPLGHPIGADPERFHLIAPFESDSTQWTQIPWTEQYTGLSYRITTAGQHGTRHAARVKTYGDVLEEYAWHPETKCAGPTGQPCDRQTVGLLQRRHVWLDELTYIGKESNNLEEVESGLVHAATDVYTEYVDPRRDSWSRVQAILQSISLDEFERLTGKPRRLLIDARTGRRRPRSATRALLEQLARDLAVRTKKRPAS